MEYQTIILLYILFIWFVVLHTFEEIAQNIFNLKLKRIKVTKNKYLFGASIITTVNLSTLALIILGNKYGLYLGIFTSSIIGVFQVIIHTIGYIKEGGKSQNLGAGFYSSIPLSIVGALLLYNILIIL